MRHGEEKDYVFDGFGKVGSPACGDEMAMWLKIDQKKGKIIECRWRTFGCGSAIAATSILSEIITEKGGMDLDKAFKITPQDIMHRLGGLPERKIHCSVLGDQALRAAINDYYQKTKQDDKIVLSANKMIDEDLKIREKDIEEAVLEGVKDFDGLKKLLSITTSDPEKITALEEVIKFFREKYFN
jgi:NifU-like protein involved in Fe-S cluster formation